MSLPFARPDRFAVLVAVSAVILSCAGTASAQSLLGSNSLFLALDDVEITPDQHYAVVRQNRADQFALVFDLHTGQLVASPSSSAFDPCGDCVDAVAVTNTRAIVLGGHTAQILDLTNLSNPLIAEQPVGHWPNDVVITPNGQLAIVRGGSETGPSVGGQFIFRLSDGQQVAQRAGDPSLYDYNGNISYSYPNDTVACTDNVAVVLSIIGQTSSAPRTRVTIWNLHPAIPTLPPMVIFETGGGQGPDLIGAPSDLAIASDGTAAVVRSQSEISVFRLFGGLVLPQFSSRLAGNPGPLDDEPLDTVELTGTRVVTISRADDPAPDSTQVDIFSITGEHHFDRVAGSPHDLAITPDGTKAVVRTSSGVFLYDLTVLPGTQSMPAAASAAAPGSSTQYFAGLDSVAVTDRYAVTLTRAANHIDTEAWFWSLAHDQLSLLAKRTIHESRPIGLKITPDGSRAVVTGNSSISVFHLGTGGRSFEHHAVGPNAYYQWCDGVAATDDKAVGIGQWNPSGGWIDVVDMTPFAQSYCTATPNSSGQAAHLTVLGNASVSANTLKLCIDGAPAHAHGRFVYGPTQTQVPFGDGFQCVATPAYGLRFLDTNVAGAVFLDVNYLAQTNPAAVITPGSTWNFQFVFLDQASSGFGVNTSQGASIVFGP